MFAPIALVVVLSAAPHPGEAAAVSFVEQLKAGAPAKKPLELDSDREFPPAERARLFRLLESYVSTREWKVVAVEVQFVDGVDDSADVYLRSTKNEWLVLLAGYHYDVKAWKVSAYESPDMSFKKTGTFDAYVEQSVKDAKARCGKKNAKCTFFSR